MKDLFEKYRPQTFDEVVGQDKPVERIKFIGRTGYGGKAFWIYGKSGTGKTTIARIIAKEVTDFTEELDAESLTPAKIQQIEESTKGRSIFGKGGYVYIVNEAHGLRKHTIRQLLVSLERLPEYVTFIFTTTNEGQKNLFLEEVGDIAPLMSRCKVIKLEEQGIAQPFAKRAKEIAELEGLDGRPIEDYLKLVNNHKANMRAVLQAIDSGDMLTGKGE